MVLVMALEIRSKAIPGCISTVCRLASAIMSQRRQKNELFSSSLSGCDSRATRARTIAGGSGSRLIRGGGDELAENIHGRLDDATLELVGLEAETSSSERFALSALVSPSARCRRSTGGGRIRVGAARRARPRAAANAWTRVNGRMPPAGIEPAHAV